MLKVFQNISEKGITILVIEQSAKRILKIASKAYVMENGKIVMEGIGKDLINDHLIKESYLRT